METPLTIQQHKWVREALFLVDEQAASIGAMLHLPPKHDRLDDFRSIGKLALYEQVTRYDPARGKFADFARRRVRGAILNTVKAETRAERIEIAMAIAVANRMADYHDDYKFWELDEAKAEVHLDKFCETAAVVMFVAGAEQARREAEEDPVEGREEHERAFAVLKELVRALRPEEQELLSLLFVCGFDQHEAAQRLGVHKDTVWARSKRLLVKLQHEMRMQQIREAPCPRNDVPIPQFLPDDPRRPKRHNDV